MMTKQEGASSSSDDSKSWWKKVWSLKVPNKIKHFVWKSFYNCIPTRVNLRVHHGEVDCICPLCRKGYETTDHALFRCSRAKKIWRALHPFIQIGEYDYLNIQDKWFELSNTHTEAKFKLICITA